MQGLEERGSREGGEGWSEITRRRGRRKENEYEMEEEDKEEGER